MKTINERIYDGLNEVMGGCLEKFVRYGESMKLKAAGYMDLSIDNLRGGKIAMAHNYIQNGDVMADPDMMLEVDTEEKTIVPLTFQNDGLGLFQEVYDIDGQGNKTGVRVKLKRDLEHFLIQWIKNLKMQGHKAV